MLQAGSERAVPAGGMWVPGMSPRAAAPYGGPSARELEIARRRDEMLGMLHGLPESDYELSLTDLVEKTALPPTPPPTSERKEASPLGRPAGASLSLSESGRHVAEQPQQQPASKRGSSRRRGDSGGSGRSSFRSSSDGVLLNFYMPRSITRSFTSPRPTHHAPSAPAPDPDDRSKRERDCDAVRCWPMPWDRRWRKSSRRDPAGESAAILQGAKRSSAAAE